MTAVTLAAARRSPTTPPAVCAPAARAAAASQHLQERLDQGDPRQQGRGDDLLPGHVTVHPFPLSPLEDPASRGNEAGLAGRKIANSLLFDLPRMLPRH